MGIRRDGREPDDLRTLAFTRDFTQFAAGSVLVEFGQTRVLCTASVEERVPPWLRGKGRGWVTAEYSMLPGATSERNDREAARGKQSGRTQEIQRLIGRSLRAVTDLTAMGEVQITVDCDVLQADGGTRTASICGGYVALHDACSRLVADGKMGAHPLTDQCAAISVGIVDALPYLDLDYSEDVRAEVDMNVVMTGEGRFVEVQGTAEGAAVLPRRARRPAGARRGRDQRASSPSSERCWPTRLRVDSDRAAVKLVLATANPDKADEIRAVLRGRGHRRRARPAPGARPGGRRDRRHARGERAVEGGGPLRGDRPARRSPTTPGSRSTRSTVRRACPRRGSRVRTPPTPTTWTSWCELLHDVPVSARTARFTTVALARWPDGREVAAIGEVEGVIAAEPHGTGGFGYDPVFVPVEGDGRTLRRDDGGREAPGLAPGPRVPYPGRRAEGRRSPGSGPRVNRPF